MREEVRIDWAKGGGLLPAVVQDEKSLKVLMLGYMNEESWEATKASGYVTFFSRTKGRLWRKGETSGHSLKVKSWHWDCDGDSVLFRVEAKGPTCHTGRESCFEGEGEELAGRFFPEGLTKVVRSRRDGGGEESYTKGLFEAGVERRAQKVGEEGVELALASMGEDKEKIRGEAADLLFHMVVLLEGLGESIESVEKELRARHEKRE